MLDHSSVQNSNLCQLLQMLCTPPNISPVESGYNYFQMLAAKDRIHLDNKNLNTVFVSCLKLPARKFL